MASEVAQRCPRDPITGQSLSLALATYLSGRFSVNGQEGKLFSKASEVEAQQLMDYIHANLDRELSLFDLAQLIQLGPRQFFRIFSNTFGTTPHRLYH